MTRLHGFAVSGFRSLRGPLQPIGPLPKVALFAGQNNAGKSNVLRFIQDYLSGLGRSDQAGMRRPWTELDGPLGSVNGAPTTMDVAVARPVPEAEVKKIADDAGQEAQDMYAVLSGILGCPAMRMTPDSAPDLVWFRYTFTALPPGTITMSPFTIRAVPSKVQADEILKDMTAQDRSVMGLPVSDLTSRASRDRDHVIKLLGKFALNTPPVEMVGAFRQISAPIQHPVPDNYDGVGLRERLAALQNPIATRQQDRVRFHTLNRFVRTVLDDSAAELEIPHDRQTINVRSRGRLLPLENLGTGIHQVIILAAAATLLENHVVCVEEPEIHLHPLLQRKLVRYLSEETTNQYLIATHSAHILDTAGAAIFHVVDGSQGTEVDLVLAPKDRAAVCADLGYRPSDLVQANSVIWVEGPSDRTYLRHWLALSDAELVEGVHYSIMFYGGRLLSHLSADDPDVTEFISLRRLNRHIAIVIDSDRNSKRARLNATKLRVRREFESGPGFAWVTDGYAIENYVPSRILTEAVMAVHPALRIDWQGDRYQNPLRGKSVDKVDVARRVVEIWDVNTVMPSDLAAYLKKTVRFIRDANGLPWIPQPGLGGNGNG